MRKPRKKLTIIALVLVCISQILLFYYSGYYYIGKNIENEPQNNPPESPPESPPEFVVPESPIGTLGILSALAAAFGIFAISKKRKYAPNFVP